MADNASAGVTVQVPYLALRLARKQGVELSRGRQGGGVPLINLSEFELGKFSKKLSYH